MKKVTRTIYKDGEGNIIAVQAHVVVKGERPAESIFWEWSADTDGGEWNRAKLEEGE